MAAYNYVALLGNVTRDIQVKHTQGGTAVCEVGMAINEKYKDKQGNVVEKCTFVDVTLWGRTAEVAGEYLRKGAPVLISGKLQLDQWEDRESGQKRSKLKVVGEMLQLLGSRNGGGGGGGDRQQHHDSGGDTTPSPEQAANAFDGTGASYAGSDDVPF